MSVVIAVAAAFGLVGFGMLVSPEMARLRKRRRERKRETAPAPLRTVPERLHAVPDDDQPRPSLHVIHGDGGTVVPFRPRQAETFASRAPRAIRSATAPTPPEPLQAPPIIEA